MAFSPKAQIRRWWLQLRYGKGPQAVPKILDASTLASALEAARFLSAQGVDIRSLAAGEEAGAPRPADESNAPPEIGEPKCSNSA